MTYFAAALVFLIAAETLIAAGYGFPAAPAEAPETLVLVHMVTIGWLSLLMCGALFQFVPVLVARPLCSPGLVLPAFLALVSGLAFLLAGFLQLAGTIDTGIPLLALGGTLMPAGFVLAAWVLARTLWAARPLPLPARFVAVGIVSVLATALFGALLAGNLSGLTATTGQVDVRARVLPYHAAAGFGGWLNFTAIGVSYRLLPMFMLAPEAERPTSRAVWWSGSIALILLVVAAPAIVLLGESTGLVMAFAGLLGFAALVLYGADLVFFYSHRRRRNLELNIKAAAGAFGMLYLSAVLIAALAATDTLARHAGALVYLVAFGWLTGLGLSQLYKIIPFLTWLECYGPVMGRKPTPRVQDLVVERRGKPWFALYFLGVLAGTGSLLIEMPNLFRVAVTATLVATVAIITELVRARRLSPVSAGLRLPEGTSRPGLFLPSMHHR